MSTRTQTRKPSDERAYWTGYAFRLGSRDGAEDVAEDPGTYTPTYGNLWIGRDYELASAYADGYVASWNAGIDEWEARAR